MNTHEIIMTALRNNGYPTTDSGADLSDLKYYWATWHTLTTPNPFGSVWRFPGNDEAIAWAKESGATALAGPFHGVRDSRKAQVNPASDFLWTHEEDSKPPMIRPNQIYRVRAFENRPVRELLGSTIEEAVRLRENWEDTLGEVSLIPNKTYVLDLSDGEIRLTREKLVRIVEDYLEWERNQDIPPACFICHEPMLAGQPIKSYWAIDDGDEENGPAQDPGDPVLTQAHETCYHEKYPHTRNIIREESLYSIGGAITKGSDLIRFVELMRQIKREF